MLVADLKLQALTFVKLWNSSSSIDSVTEELNRLVTACVLSESDESFVQFLKHVLYAR